MKQWMHTRPARLSGLLLALSLLLTACDPQDLMQLLDAQPVAQEAPAAAKADRTHEADERASKSEADEASAERAAKKAERAAKKAERTKQKAEERTRHRTRRAAKKTTEREAAPAPKPTAKESDGGSGGGGAASVSSVEQQIYDRLNSTRRGAGLKALALSGEISRGARSWSCQMAQSGNFRHADLGSAGVSGENIAWGQSGAAAVHQAWMDSPGHRDNRMSSRWSEYGVGVCKDSNGRPYYTERFR